ncbi:MAG: glycosyltransferase family 9 protein [Maribacter sp.]|nr:glycosyltransferase family 9 protein [Maribacter sp.]
MAQSEKQTSHILVIRLSAMGDVAMTIPVLLAFTQKYPELRVTVLTKAFFKPLFSKIPNVDVFVADVNGRHKGFLGIWRLYKVLENLGIDTVADLHNVLRSNILKLLFRLKGIPFFQIDKGRFEKRALTRIKNKVFKPLKTTHERYADVFVRMGYPIELTKTEFLPKNEINSHVVDLVGPHSNKWIGIAPFAAFQGKMYPLSLLNEVLDELNKTNDYKILFFGGGFTEQELLEKMAADYANSFNTVGKLTFEEQLDLISNLDLMLSMDSGNAHLAALYAIPTITLWGVTHPYAGFYPYGQDIGNALLADRDLFPFIPTSIYGKKVPPGYENAMATIPPYRILDKIKDILEKK